MLLEWLFQSTKNISKIFYYLISNLLNVYYDFDIYVANDITIDVAKRAFPGKVMQGTSLPHVNLKTHGRWGYIMK